MTSLTMQNVFATYGRGWALEDVSLECEKGAAVAILGANGAGKTSITRVLAGVLSPHHGSVRVGADDVTRWSPRARTRRAHISVVPEGRMIFPALSVQENLLVGRQGTKGEIEGRLTDVLGTFPRLAERRKQLAGTLSGGEQQMLAVSRALLTRPDFLVIDEPSLGLSPAAVARLYEALAHLRKEFGIAILLVEQNIGLALKIADTGYVLKSGKVVAHGSGAELLGSGQLLEAYLGSQ